MFFSVFRCVRVPSPQHLLDNSTGDASTLRAQLNAEVEGRRVDGVTAEERLRKELQDLRQSLVAEWAERVEQEVQRARKVHQQEVSDLVRKHEQEMESARAEHLSQVEALEKKIHTLQEDASRQGNEASRLLVRSRQEHAEQMKNLQEEQQRMSEETRDRCWDFFLFVLLPVWMHASEDFFPSALLSVPQLGQNPNSNHSVAAGMPRKWNACTRSTVML